MKIKVIYRRCITKDRIFFYLSRVSDIYITYPKEQDTYYTFNSLPDQYKKLFRYLDNKIIDIFNVEHKHNLTTKFEIDIIKYTRELKIRDILDSNE